jgi:hypothetical protein
VRWTQETTTSKINVILTIYLRLRIENCRLENYRLTLHETNAIGRIGQHFEGRNFKNLDP